MIKGPKVTDDCLIVQNAVQLLESRVLGQVFGVLSDPAPIRLKGQCHEIFGHFFIS